MAVEAISQSHCEAETSQKITLFKLHNITIQSALYVTNNEDGVETVLNLERTTLANAGNNMSAWHRFTISSTAPGRDSRFATGDAVWTQHCSGLVRAECTATTAEFYQRIQIGSRSRSVDVER